VKEGEPVVPVEETPLSAIVAAQSRCKPHPVTKKEVVINQASSELAPEFFFQLPKRRK